jgi:RNA polymerase sigma-70 factor (ECF subfamily)
MERRVRFELLFRRYEPAVRAYALRRANAALADDVVAEVFVVCWRRFDEIPAEPLPWLLGVARHVLGTLRRGEHRHAALQWRLAENETARPQDVPKVSDGVLATAMAQLREGDRELLLLVAWEGLSSSEIAVSLGIRPSTARVRLMRARRRLRGELNRAEATQPCVPARMEVS